jgi:hypothetical protein
MPTPTPINLAGLLPALDQKLLELLRSLSDQDWHTQTIARLWKVKDVVAHLLDGNIRSISILRDNYRGEIADIRSYQDLVQFLNGLNADWIKAMKRVSPRMLMALHEITGPVYCTFMQSLEPMAKSALAVDWAGESESKNWMHIAREYTEKFLHQQQIRDAVNKPGLMTREFFHPFISTFMYGLPHTFRDVHADEGASIQLTVATPIGGTWWLRRAEGAWRLSAEGLQPATASVTIEPDDAWKLFSKSWREQDVIDRVSITGDLSLGKVALSMVSVIA